MGWASARPVAVHSLRRRLKPWKRKTIWKWSTLWQEVPLYSSRLASHRYSSSRSLSSRHPYFTSVIQGPLPENMLFSCDTWRQYKADLKLKKCCGKFILFYFSPCLFRFCWWATTARWVWSPIGQCNPTASLGWASHVHSCGFWLGLCGKWGTGE